MSIVTLRRIGYLLCAVVVCLGALPGAASPRYDGTPAADFCVSCHPSFQGRAELHDLHQGNGQFTNTCQHCHVGTGDNPLLMYSGSSAGYGCTGCHGRDHGETIQQDYGIGLIGTPKMSGYGLRLQHFNKGITSCSAAACHGSATAVTPMPENVDPPYYALGDVDITDACNTDGSEDTPETEPNGDDSLGLDNDGDGLIDGLDPDCGAAGTPGESAGFGLNPLLVTGHDTATDTLTLTIGVPCSATDQTLYAGPLTALSSYGYNVRDCTIDASGTHTWVYGAASPSLFFLVVANDGAVEGSYGKDSAGAERPPDPGNTFCPTPQDLSARCDP